MLGLPADGIRRLAVPKEGGAEEILRERLQAIPEHPETLLVSKDPAGTVHWAKSKLNLGWHKVWAVAGFGGRFHSLRAYHLTWFGQRGASLKELQARGVWVALCWSVRGKPSQFAHTEDHSTLRWCWVEGGVGGPAYPPQVLVHPSPAIITTVETIGQIATGETVWAVRSAYSHG